MKPVLLIDLDETLGQYQFAMGSWLIRPGFPELLQRLSEQVDTYLYTAAMPVYAENALREMGIASLFQKVLSTRTQEEIDFSFLEGRSFVWVDDRQDYVKAKKLWEAGYMQEWEHLIQIPSFHGKPEGAYLSRKLETKILKYVRIL